MYLMTETLWESLAADNRWQVMNMRFERGPFGKIAICNIASEDEVALHALDILQNHIISSILPVYLRTQVGNVQICIDCTGFLSVSEMKTHEWDNLTQKRACIADFLKTLLIAQDHFLNVDFFIIDSEYIFFDPEEKKLYWCYIPTNIPVNIPINENGNTTSTFLWEKLELLLMDPFFSDAVEEEDRNQILSMLHDEREEDLVSFLSDYSNVTIHSEKITQNGSTLKNRLALLFFVMAACYVVCVRFNWRQFPVFSENRWALWYVFIFTLGLVLSLLIKSRKRQSSDIAQKCIEIESQKALSRKNLYFPAADELSDKHSTQSNNPLFSPAFLTQNDTSLSRSNKPLRAVIWVSDFLIGSDRFLCDFCIDDACISDRHARVLYRKPLYFLVDLGSADGTWIGSRRLYSYEENPLSDGDIVVLGNLHFKFDYNAQF